MSTILTRNPESFQGYEQFKIKLADINDQLLQIMYNDKDLTTTKFFDTKYMKDNMHHNRKYLYFHTKKTNVEHVKKWGNEIDSDFNSVPILE